MEKTHALTLIAIPALASSLWVDALTLYADVASVGDQTEYFPPPSVEVGIHNAEILETSPIAPGPGLPSDLSVLSSNNSLDVIRHQGRVYLAFRSASAHHASADAAIHVLSSSDELTWTRETKVALGSEVRQPRFLSYDDKLFLYASEPSNSGLGGTESRVLGTHLSHAGWSDVRVLDLPGHVVSSAQMQHGLPLMTTHSSGSLRKEQPRISLLTTRDGYEWHPLSAGRQTVSEAGARQASFTGDDDGNLYSVLSNSAGNESGFGSSVCFAPASEWTDWDCVHDPRRYDSSTMFAHDGEIYLIGRRNLTEDGFYDQGVGPQLLRAVTNQLDYVTAGKRCSLWRYVKSERRVAFVLDLPSRGDTCSPAVVETDTHGQFAIYNYSSALSGPEMSLGVGQTRPTSVYRHILSLTGKGTDRRSAL